MSGRPSAGGHLPGKLGLAGAGFALHQKRPLQRHRRVDGNGQVVGRDIGVGAGKFHADFKTLLGRSQER
jgi:hypothetical protein